MSSWFGDGLTSLKGQLTNLAKALSEEPTSLGGESSKVSLPVTQNDDERAKLEPDSPEGSHKSSEGTTDSGASGWTDIQLVHPSDSPFHSGDEEVKEDKKNKDFHKKEKVVTDKNSSFLETEKDVSAIIRGGIANLFQIPRANDNLVSSYSEGTVTRKDEYAQTELSQDQTALLIVALQDRIDELTQENESLQLNVSNLGRAAADLEAQVAVSQDENANLSTGLEELDIQHQRAIENVLVGRDETQREYENLKVKYAELEEEIKILKLKDDEVEKIKEKERGKEKELMRELEERDRELDCLEGENSSLRETIKELLKEQEEKSKETLATISEQDGEELEAMERQVELYKKDLQIAQASLKENAVNITQLTEQIKSITLERDELKKYEEIAMNYESKQENDKHMSDLENKVVELENKLLLISNDKAEAESVIAHLESQLDAANKSNCNSSDSEEKISYLEEENKLLHSKMILLESRLIELTDQKDHYQKESELKDRKMCELLLESNETETECKNNLEKIESNYNQILVEFNNYKEESQKKIELKDLEITKLNSRIEADNEIIVASAVNDELSEKLNLLELENEKIMDESYKMKLENQDLHSRIKILNENLEMSNKELDQLKNEFEHLKKQSQFEIRTLESKLNGLSQESQQYHIDKDVFSQKETELKNQLKLKDEELSSFKTFKQQCEMIFKEKLSSVENEYKNIIQEKDNKLEEFSNIQTEINTLKTSLEEKIINYEESIVNKDKEIMDIKEQLDGLMKEKENISNKLVSIQQEYEQLKQSQLNTEQYEKERESFLRKIESITSQNAQLLSDVVRLNAKHSSLKNQMVASHNEEITMLKEKLSSTENELRNARVQLLAEIDELKKKLRTAESERDELFKNIQIKHNECIGFQTEVLKFNEVLKAEKLKLEAIVIEKAQLEMKCENLNLLEVEVENFKKENASLSQEVKVLKEQLDNASELIKEIKRTEAEGQSAEDTSAKNVKCAEGCEKTHEELNKLSWALHNEQVSNKTLQRQISDLKEKFEKSEVQLRRLQVHLVEIEQNHTTEQIEMEQMKAKLEKAEERLRQSSTAYTSANIRVNQQVESLTHQVQMLNETKERLEADLSNAEDSVLKQQAAVTNLQAVLHQFQLDKQRDIEFETERMRQQLKESHDKYEQLNIEMRKTLEQMNEMKKGLEAASRLSEQLDNKSHIIETLKSEATVLKEKLEKEKAKVNEINSSVEGKIDRNLIKNLIIGYMQAHEKSKEQVLRVLASVLELDTEERRKLSLEPQTQGQQQSLSEAFIKFLENESQPKPKLILSMPPTPDGTRSRRTSHSSNSSVLLSTEATSTLSHSPVLPPYPIRPNPSILKDLLKDTTPNTGPSSS